MRLEMTLWGNDSHFCHTLSTSWALFLGLGSLKMLSCSKTQWFSIGLRSGELPGQSVSWIVFPPWQSPWSLDGKFLFLLKYLSFIFGAFLVNHKAKSTTNMRTSRKHSPIFIAEHIITLRKTNNARMLYDWKVSNLCHELFVSFR